MFTYPRRLTLLEIVCRESWTEEQGLLAEVVPLGWAQLPTAVGEQTNGHRNRQARIAAPSTSKHKRHICTTANTHIYDKYKVRRKTLHTGFAVTIVCWSSLTFNTLVPSVSQFLCYKREFLLRSGRYCSSEYLHSSTIFHLLIYLCDGCEHFGGTDCLYLQGWFPGVYTVRERVGVAVTL